MLLWAFRVIFLIVVVAVLLLTATSDEITKQENATSWWAMVISGTGMMIFVFFTPLEVCLYMVRNQFQTASFLGIPVLIWQKKNFAKIFLFKTSNGVHSPNISSNFLSISLISTFLGFSDILDCSITFARGRILLGASIIF